jgi:signal transduction histidine kinase/CheY-like chemotaxis protein
VRIADAQKAPSATPVAISGLRPVWLAAATRDVALNVVVAIAYWGLAELALLARTPTGSVTPLWPAAGVAVAAVILRGPSLLPGIAVGALLVFVARLPLAAALLTATAVVLEPLLDRFLLRRAGFDERLERVRDTVLLAAVAAVGAAFVATISTGAGFLVGSLAADGVPANWLMWWMRDTLGVTIVVAVVLAWACGRPIKWTRAQVLEGLGVAGVLLILSQLLIGLWAIFPTQNAPFAFLLFPIVAWAGIRFGPRGAATVVAAIAALMMPIAALGVGPFATFPLGFVQVLLTIFLLLTSVSGQAFAALMIEREEAHQRRLALEEQLRHSQKMEAIGRLAGGIAHDFNNLLTAIIGYSEIVMTGLGPTDPRRGDAEEIARAAMRAADLTRQMLAFSRKQVLQAKVIDLNTTLSKVEPMLRRVIGEDIVMNIAPRATRASVRVDPGQIEQVIMNLVVNARDAMPQGGRLTVETGDATLDATMLPPDGKPGDYAMLAVSDTGIGMRPEVRARIFEPYFTTKEIGKGTGLGLSTAYGIIRQSDGYIHVFSEPGQGTTFRIYLPREQVAAVEAVEAGSDHLPRGTEHVLLVEDDPSVRRMSRELLIRLGYSVTEAGSGRAGLALGSDDTRHFDLALCDVILGDMSGPAVYEALRALRPSVRVLYMSGHADDALVRTGVLDEGHPFLQKPFTPQDLAIKIREILDHTDEHDA